MLILRVSFSCILSKFYIKPQPYKNYYANKQGCILSKFYIKPQPKISSVLAVVGCILSKFYIKPQLRRWRQCHYVVVSY